MAMAAFITGNILIMALCVVSLIIHARRDHTLVDNLEEYRAQLEALRQKSAREREARLLAAALPEAQAADIEAPARLDTDLSPEPPGEPEEAARA